MKNMSTQSLRHLLKKPLTLLIASVALFVSGAGVFGIGFDLPHCQQLDNRCGAVLDPFMYIGIVMLIISIVIALGAFGLLIWRWTYNDTLQEKAIDIETSSSKTAFARARIMSLIGCMLGMIIGLLTLRIVF